MFSLAGFLMLTATLVNGPVERTADPLTVSVTPRVAIGPTHARITARVDPHPDNRLLSIVADSPYYRWASQDDLEGEREPTVHTLLLKGVPPGKYLITARVSGKGDREFVSTCTLTVMGERK